MDRLLIEKREHDEHMNKQGKRAQVIENLLEEMDAKREKRHNFEDLIYSQERLSDAINEAKSINVLLDQTRMKMKQLKTNLEQKTLP